MRRIDRRADVIESSKILPGTGRGTIALAMVEGALCERSVQPQVPSTTLRAVPLPVPGRILL